MCGGQKAGFGGVGRTAGYPLLALRSPAALHVAWEFAEHKVRVGTTAGKPPPAHSFCLGQTPECSIRSALTQAAFDREDSIVRNCRGLAATLARVPKMAVAGAVGWLAMAGVTLAGAATSTRTSGLPTRAHAGGGISSSDAAGSRSPVRTSWPSSCRAWRSPPSRSSSSRSCCGGRPPPDFEWDTVETLGMAEVLFVCTGNLCRSPSAALFLRQQLGSAGSEVTVHSAGTMEVGVGPPRALVLEGRALGIDLADHVPRMVDPDTIQAADLVVGLAREHLRETVVAVPSSFPKTFTLREIVRRGLDTGPRGAPEDLGAWLARLHDGRLRADLMGESPDDDVRDPMGGTPDDYRGMLTEVATLTRTLRNLAWPMPKLPAEG